MPTLGTGELIIALIIVVLIFGATRLPRLGSAIGLAIRNFRRGAADPAPPELDD